MYQHFNTTQFFLFYLFSAVLLVVFFILLYRLYKLRQLKRKGIEFIWTIASLVVLLGLTAPAIYYLFHTLWKH